MVRVRPVADAPGSVSACEADLIVFLALSRQNVINRGVHGALVPKITSASVMRPNRRVSRTTGPFSKTPRAPRLEMGKNSFRATKHCGRNDDVYVVGAKVDGVQDPFAMRTALANSSFHNPT